MSTAIPAILAALPREIGGLVMGARPDAALLRKGIHLYRLRAATVVTAGMGPARVALALEAALATSAIHTIVSVGLAGGCQSQVAAGEVYEAETVISAQTGERFRTAAPSGGITLVTTESIAGIHEKARLAATYQAAIVDMEAATLGRLALAHNIPFRAIKAISDPHDFELASLSRFATSQGQFRTTAFAVHTALRPHHWRPAARLGRHSNQGLKRLQSRLSALFLQA